MLNTIGCFLFSFPYGKKHLSQLGLLEDVIELLGWPSILTGENAEINATIQSHPSLEKEYIIQTISLCIILEIM